MNLNICRYKCNAQSYPRYIVHDNDGWYIVMYDGFGNERQCGWQCIESANSMMKKPPEGCVVSSGKLLFAGGDFEHIMWNVHLKAGCSCPFLLEHTMCDIDHKRRIDEYKHKMELTSNKKVAKEDDDAKTDSKKLP